MKIKKIDANGKEYDYGGGYKDPYEVIPKIINLMVCFMKQATQKPFI